MKNGFFTRVLRLSRQRREFWLRPKRHNSPVSAKGRIFVMQMRKSIALGAAILLLALPAAGCGGKTVSSSSGGATRSSGTASSESTGSGETLLTQGSGESEGGSTSASESGQNSGSRPQGGSSGAPQKQTTASVTTKTSGSNTPSGAPKKSIRLFSHNISG